MPFLLCVYLIGSGCNCLAFFSAHKPASVCDEPRLVCFPDLRIKAFPFYDLGVTDSDVDLVADFDCGLIDVFSRSVDLLQMFPFFLGELGLKLFFNSFFGRQIFACKPFFEHVFGYWPNLCGPLKLNLLLACVSRHGKTHRKVLPELGHGHGVVLALGDLLNDWAHSGHHSASNGSASHTAPQFLSNLVRSPPDGIYDRLTGGDRSDSLRGELPDHCRFWGFPLSLINLLKRLFPNVGLFSQKPTSLSNFPSCGRSKGKCSAVNHGWPNYRDSFSHGGKGGCSLCCGHSCGHLRRRRPKAKCSGYGCASPIRLLLLKLADVGVKHFDSFILGKLSTRHCRGHVSGVFKLTGRDFGLLRRRSRRFPDHAGNDSCNVFLSRGFVALNLKRFTRRSCKFPSRHRL